jgi:O-succinylbenzoic acid--CoA ligase
MMAALSAVLDGSATPVLPVPGGDLRQYELLTTSLRVGEEIDDDVALVVPTSGTTGTPKGAMLTAPALIASATATHDRLGGPGTWLLALPPHHIAGVQVLIRSVVAGTTPVEIDVSDGFDVAPLPAAVSALMMGSGRKYASLVGVQLAKALADPAAGAALTQLDAVLLGGGPAPAWVLESAAVAGISVVRSYGMSETAGGCVYDGLPLDGVRVRIDDDDRIVLGGSTLAKGYRNPTTPDPFGEPGWFRTDDIGALDDSGVLRVLGRADDAISTGGLTVLPQPVEAALNTHPDVVDCAVFGLPDERLGQRVAVAVVLAEAAAAPTVAELREHITQTLDPTAAPREVHIVDEVPRLGIGKVDRRTLVQRFSIG